MIRRHDDDRRVLADLAADVWDLEGDTKRDPALDDEADWYDDEGVEGEMDMEPW